MKKIILLCAISAALMISGCGKKDSEMREENPTIPAKIAEQMTGDNKEIETYETSGELADVIKSVNSGAQVRQTDNPGLKMLSVELPIDNEDKLSEEFVSQVEKIITKTKLDQNTDYNYFYFSSSKDDSVLVYASFKNEDGTFKADKSAAVDGKYSDSLAKAVEKSDMFK